MGDDWDWESILSPVGSAASSVGSAIGTGLTDAAGSVAKAIPQIYVANRGQKIAQQANQAAADAATAGGNAAIGSITAGANAGQNTLNAIAARSAGIAAPGTTAIRDVVATNPYTLTPQQTALLNQQREQMINNMDPSVRGNAASYVGATTAFNNANEAPLIQQNLARHDTAANTLFSEGTGAENAAQTGIANLEAGTGKAVGGVQQATANTVANADTASGTVGADTLGAIGGYFAGQNAAAGRNSAYQGYKSGLASNTTG